MYLRGLFEEKKVSEQHREQLWQYYYDKLSKGVDIGFSPKSLHYDKDLADTLKYNIAEFSAFKETSFRRVVESLLVDEIGGLRSWRDFKKEAYKVSSDYNHRWLETEYHQTVANAQMAEKWKGFEANADLYPNLKLVSVGDDRVRPEHKILDGTIRPIDDPFWKTHTPPLDWGCRCDIIQTDEEPTNIKGGLQLKIEFENNPALTGKIFGGSAYMTSGGLNPEMIEEVGRFAKRMFEKSVEKGREIIEKTKLFAPYKTIHKAKNGAKVSVSPFADKNDLDKNVKSAKIIANKLGVSVKIRPHINLQGHKNPEYEIKKLLADRKETKSYTGIKSNLESAKKQGNNIVVFDISNFENWNAQQIVRSLKGKLSSFNDREWLKETYIIYNKNTVMIKGKDIFKDFDKVVEELKAIEP